MSFVMEFSVHHENSPARLCWQFYSIILFTHSLFSWAPLYRWLNSSLNQLMPHRSRSFLFVFIYVKYNIDFSHSFRIFYNNENTKITIYASSVCTAYIQCLTVDINNKVFTFGTNAQMSLTWGRKAAQPKNKHQESLSPCSRSLCLRHRRHC